MTTVGAVFLPQFAPELLRPVAQAADAAGLAELWLWEDCFAESGVASAAAVLAWTSRLRVGLGVLPVPLRNVALTAMEIATLDRLFPERITVGVGHGVQDWMVQVGARVESPLGLLREYATSLGGLLRGETVTVSGRYVHLDEVRLAWPPLSAPTLAAGAGGPRSLALCGEIADMIVLTGGTSPEGVRAARRFVEEGRSASGRARPQPVTVYVPAATGPGAAERMATHRRVWGYAADQEVGVVGDAAGIAAALAPWVAAGADTIVLQPTADEPDPVGFVELVGSQVTPLMR
ncbi:LLM class flavin-dependent oxidoreductase [Cellulomonas sp. KRMCY2]|uniref:LLM class flavin-dependent oxidoreductase n=1 Tax=Cellulomonas sp. KRMCY2 TaxID=1304865 RepID=UPI00045E87CB|nr:LLM class flavin-dependent oxidoreductase [Cellulomonas sp. KRMCY2]